MNAAGTTVEETLLRRIAKHTSLSIVAAVASFAILANGSIASAHELPRTINPAFPVHVAGGGTQPPPGFIYTNYIGTYLGPDASDRCRSTGLGGVASRAWIDFYCYDSAPQRSELYVDPN